MERENISKLHPLLVQTKNTKLDQLKKKLVELSMASKARATLLNNESEKKKLLETSEHYKNLAGEEEVVAEKEKIIMELRSKTRTLENFRSCLITGCSSCRQSVVLSPRTSRGWSATSPPCTRSWWRSLRTRKAA